ncbi:unnamed protein product [Phytophthora fragariaefolia]|uniref:Unnamed protein product n=1 Tax=Phytophthora fragariaefolia TaxID=1490495 RepID=A0A9W7CYU6_9STRA|nr:unnamed protein product [Phytophthora fragariaefolia]
MARNQSPNPRPRQQRRRRDEDTAADAASSPRRSTTDGARNADAPHSTPPRVDGGLHGDDEADVRVYEHGPAPEPRADGANAPAAGPVAAADVSSSRGCPKASEEEGQPTHISRPGH